MAKTGRPGKGDVERAASRRVESLRLRQQGLSYREIAKRLCIGVKTAFQDVDVALSEVAELEHHEARKLRHLELGRYDKMLAVLWPKALKQDYDALDRVLKIMERRSELVGLTGAHRINPWGDALPGPGESAPPAAEIPAVPAPSVSVTVINQQTTVEIAQVLALAKEHGLLDRLLRLPEVVTRVEIEDDHANGNGHGAGDGAQRLGS